MSSFSSTIENYIKQVYLISEGNEPDDEAPVSMKRLVAAMDVAPGTATAMVKTLAAEGLVDYVPREGVRLTESGRDLALGLVRRHRLIELFLVNVLHIDWSDVHDDAEVLEHAVSDRIVERMDMLLGRPAHGPHGKPIPDSGGHVELALHTPLDEVPDGANVKLAEIGEDDPSLLRLFDDRGFSIGAACVVTHDETAHTVTLHNGDGGSLTLGREPARAIRVDMTP